MNYVYLVKNLSPWMINELQAFSRFVSFRLIILRNVNEMYKNDLAFLEKSGVEIFIKPFLSYLVSEKLSLCSFL